MWKILKKKATTARRVLGERGAQATTAIAKDKLIQLMHRRPGGLAELDGCRFPISHFGDQAIPFLRGHYEQYEIRAVKRFLDPNRPVIELGGSIGVVACITNRMLRDRTRHRVVEADPQIIPKLKHNRDSNRCHFDILNYAVAYGSESVSFTTGQNSLSGGVHVKGAGEVMVASITLERLVADAGFRRFTLICDIEGSEVELIEREHSLLFGAVDTFILETHPAIMGGPRTEAALSTLRSGGFTVLEKYSDTLVLRNTARALTT